MITLLRTLLLVAVVGAVRVDEENAVASGVITAAATAAESSAWGWSTLRPLFNLARKLGMISGPAEEAKVTAPAKPHSPPTGPALAEESKGSSATAQVPVELPEVPSPPELPQVPEVSLPKGGAPAQATPSQGHQGNSTPEATNDTAENLNDVDKEVKTHLDARAKRAAHADNVKKAIALGHAEANLDVTDAEAKAKRCVVAGQTQACEKPANYDEEIKNMAVESPTEEKADTAAAPAASAAANAKRAAPWDTAPKVAENAEEMAQEEVREAAALEETDSKEERAARSASMHSLETSSQVLAAARKAFDNAEAATVSALEVADKKAAKATSLSEKASFSAEAVDAANAESEVDSSSNGLMEETGFEVPCGSFSSMEGCPGRCSWSWSGSGSLKMGVCSEVAKTADMKDSGLGASKTFNALLEGPTLDLLSPAPAAAKASSSKPAARAAAAGVVSSPAVNGLLEGQAAGSSIDDWNKKVHEDIAKNDAEIWAQSTGPGEDVALAAVDHQMETVTNQIQTLEQTFGSVGIAAS
jgi:hypothetical protein